MGLIAGGRRGATSRKPDMLLIDLHFWKVRDDRSQTSMSDGKNTSIWICRTWNSKCTEIKRLCGDWHLSSLTCRLWWDSSLTHGLWRVSSLTHDLWWDTTIWQSKYPEVIHRGINGLNTATRVASQKWRRLGSSFTVPTPDMDLLSWLRGEWNDAVAEEHGGGVSPVIRRQLSLVYITRRWREPTLIIWPTLPRLCTCYSNKGTSIAVTLFSVLSF